MTAKNSASAIPESGEEIPPFVVRFYLLEVLCRKRTVFLPEGDEGRECESPVVRKGSSLDTVSKSLTAIQS